MKIGELRERFEELKFCKLGDQTMHSYDRYMNVQGFLKKKYIKPSENPIKQKQDLKVML